MQISSFYVDDVSAVSKCVRRLKYAVEQSEQEPHIRENMIGDVDWSMVNLILTRYRMGNGFITVAYDNDELAGIVGCDVNDLVWADSVQFGIRLWVHPRLRGSRLPTLLIEPSLKSAKALRVKAWTSFNDDRFAMLRMIDIRSKDNDGRVSSLWSGFQSLPDKVLIHNTPQYVAYKDFSAQ